MAKNVLNIRKPDGFHNGSTVNVLCILRGQTLSVPALIELPNMAVLGVEKVFSAGVKIAFGPSGNRQNKTLICKASTEEQLGIKFQSKLNEVLADLPDEVVPDEKLIVKKQSPTKSRAARKAVAAVA